MSVPITYRQKKDFSSCVKMVGFPKYGHISVCMSLASTPASGLKVMTLKKRRLLDTFMILIFCIFVF